MNKTIFITGSTDGIGKLTATNLAKEGHSVYIHGRNPEKLSEAISEIKEITGNENVEGFLADFSDLDSVKQMAEDIKAKITKIDVLINNAGVFKSPVADNQDGLDLRMVVNYLAPYLLTHELISLLGKGSRIVNLSSAAQSPVSHDVLLGNVKKSTDETYAQSKLALTMWSFYLAEKISVAEVSVIAVNPGSLLNTKMANEAYGQHWSSADKGANILHDLAVSKDYDGITGKYFDNDKGTFGMAHPDAYDKTKITDLMDVTDNLLNLEKQK